MSGSFYGETGLYEMVAEFSEESCYTAPKIILHPAVYEIDAELNADGGSLFIDLPQAGFRMTATLSFVTGKLDAEVEVKLPGTGITLTAHRLTGYHLDTDGLVLYGQAVNPKDGSTLSYEIKAVFEYGILLSEAEASLWKGADRDGTPLHTYHWKLDETGEDE